MYNKNKILIIIGIVITLVLAILGASYAWFSTMADNNGSVTINSGTLSITYTQGTKIEANNLKPATKTQVLDAYNAGNCKYNNEDYNEQICYANNFIVTNTGTLSALVTTNLSNVVNTYSNYLLYEIFETTPLSLTGNILGTNQTLIGLANNTLIPPTVNNSKSYTLLIWLDENAGNDDQGKSYTALINTTGIQTNEVAVEEPTLFKVNGYVYNSSNQIIPNATLIINKQSVTTDTKGYYEATNIPSGTHTITVTDSSKNQILSDTFTLQVGNDYNVSDKVITAKPNKVKIDLHANNSQKIETIAVVEAPLTLEFITNFGGTSTDYFYETTQSYNANGEIDGYIAVGNLNPKDTEFIDHGGLEFLIVKYNLSGEQQWAHSFGGSGSDCFHSVTPSYNTNDIIDGYIAAGYSSSSNAGFTHEGVNDGILVKYSLAGEQEWIKVFGGSGSDYFESIAPSYNANSEVDGYVAAGYSGSTNAGFTSSGSNDTIILKYNLAGEQEWIKSFGGNGTEVFKSVTPSYDGNGVIDGYIAAGYSTSTNAGFTNKGNNDIIIVKYSLEGTQKWVQSFGGSKQEIIQASVLSYDINGQVDGCILIGNSTSTDASFKSKGSNDAIIAKFN